MVWGRSEGGYLHRHRETISQQRRIYDTTYPPFIMLSFYMFLEDGIIGTFGLLEEIPKTVVYTWSLLITRTLTTVVTIARITNH